MPKSPIFSHASAEKKFHKKKRKVEKVLIYVVCRPKKGFEIKLI